MGKKDTKSTKPGVMIYFEILPVLEQLWWWQRLAILEAMIYYARDRRLPNFRGAAKAVWALIQPILDRDDERYQKTVSARKKGGRLRGEQMKAEANKRSETPVSADTAAAKLELSELKKDGQLQVSSDSQSTISNSQSTISNPQSSNINPQTAISNPQSPNNNLQSSAVREGESYHREMSLESEWRPPSVQQVRDFVSHEGLRVVPEDFVDYYNANGWLIGGVPIRDWKAVARRWSRKEKENGGSGYEGIHIGKVC